jgi:hypothetical protein
MFQARLHEEDDLAAGRRRRRGCGVPREVEAPRLARRSRP